MNLIKITQLILFVLLMIPSFLNAQASKFLETERFAFYNHFWFNLHHFAKHEAVLNTHLDSSIIDTEEWKQLNTNEEISLKKLIEYYKKNLVDKDLRTDDYMFDFKLWVLTQEEDGLEEIPVAFSEHCQQLLSAQQAYKNHFWHKHRTANESIVQYNLQWIKDSEMELSEKLANLTYSYWQDEKIRVDLSFYAKADKWNTRDKPYTNLHPETHIVMNTDSNEYPGNWFELLFHESSHHLIRTRTGFVSGTINDISKTLNQKSPRQLWHAYLFYFSGKVVQEFLQENGVPNYELYMVRNRVFSRNFKLIDTHLPAYIEGKSTLHDVTKKIIQAANQK